jgi:hypothetical protein
MADLLKGQARTLQPSVTFVCDVVAAVERGAVDAGEQLTPDGRGYFGWNSQLKLYFEIISYEKVVGDALRRNRMLFKKLGLPTDRSDDDWLGY